MRRVILLCIVSALLLSMAGCGSIRIPKGELALLTYQVPAEGNTARYAETLPSAESAKLRQVLMDAKPNPGVGGCAFTENISFTFGDQVFAVAYDGCSVIWDMNNDKYYVLDQEDWDYVISLFVNYVGTW